MQYDATLDEIVEVNDPLVSPVESFHEDVVELVGESAESAGSKSAKTSNNVSKL